LDDIEQTESRKTAFANRLLRRTAPIEAFQITDSLGTTMTWRSQTIAEKINWVESIKTLSSELRAPSDAATSSSTSSMATSSALRRVRSSSPHRPDQEALASRSISMKSPDLARRQTGNGSDAPMTARAGRRAQRAASSIVLNDELPLAAASSSQSSSGSGISASAKEAAMSAAALTASPVLRPRVQAGALHVEVREGEVKLLKQILKIQKKTGKQKKKKKKKTANNTARVKEYYAPIFVRSKARSTRASVRRARSADDVAQRRRRNDGVVGGDSKVRARFFVVLECQFVSH
jgi:hypothetical protein